MDCLAGSRSRGDQDAGKRAGCRPLANIPRNATGRIYEPIFSIDLSNEEMDVR
jgi:hypothetical protein